MGTKKFATIIGLIVVTCGCGSSERVIPTGVETEIKPITVEPKFITPPPVEGKSKTPIPSPTPTPNPCPNTRPNCGI